jgi:hypothetical protein
LDISPNDVGYSKAHYECLKKIYHDLEAYRIINILTYAGTNIIYKFSDSFDNILRMELCRASHYIINDNTVDDDIVVLQGVLKTVYNYLPKKIRKQKFIIFSQFGFNSLMFLKYDASLPENKTFSSRVKEFINEVYSIKMNKKRNPRIFKNYYVKC